MLNDRIVIEQLKHNSYKAFDILYLKYFDLLYGFVFNYVKSPEHAKEIVQESFIKVWVYRNHIDPEQSFKAWLYKIAKNQIIDMLREKATKPMFEDYSDCVCNEDFVTIQDSFIDFELLLKTLHKAKMQLSPRQRQVFHLVKEMGYSSKEVSYILNLPEQVVYNYLSQSLNIIRKYVFKH